MKLIPLELTDKVEEFGGKAYQLGILKRAGFPVPEGFVLGTNLFRENSLDAILQEIKPMIEEKIKAYGHKGYMVRSSAIGEDSEDHSFAGQLDSFISSNQIEEIIGCIKKCVLSAQNERVKTYENRSTEKLRGIAVIIQQLIEPDYAGVVFTRSHLKANAMLIEYVEGHGNKLVSGEVNPFSHHFYYSNGETEPKSLIDLTEVCNTSIKIEQFYTTPIDIEWAIKDGKLYIVQARPITTPIKNREIYWSNTNVNENYPYPISPLLYSVARDAYNNYFKNLARMFRISEDQVRELEPAFSNIIGVFGCKMYYNMSSIHQILSASPFSELLIKSFDNFVGYNQDSAYQKPKAHFSEKLKFAIEFLRLNRNLNNNVTAFEKLTDSYDLKTRHAIVQNDFAKNFHGFIEIRMFSWYKASLADFFAMAYHGLLGKFCKNIYGSENIGVHNKLIQAIPGIISSKPVVVMYRIIQSIRSKADVYSVFKENSPEFFYDFIFHQNASEITKKQINEYLEKWGFRCSGELMLTEENYIENPVKFIALLKQYEQMPDHDPEKLIGVKEKESRQAKKQLMRKIMKKYFWFPPLLLYKILLFRFLLKQTHLAISCRERARLKQALLYFRFKQTLQAIENQLISNGILLNKGDLLFLRHPEISEILSASFMLPDSIQNLIAQRKESFKSESQKTYPDDFYTPEGKHQQPEEVVQKKEDCPEGTKILKGLCACGGVVKGRVVVLENVMEAGKIKQGDILVTRQTDPGWVVVFPLISGLIVERGGMLSHGAIVSREFGIPAIVGVNNATTILKDNDDILLNADKGEISIL